MKTWCLIILLSLGCTSIHAQSIDPVSLVVAKVIKAIDLQVQKLQNQTIWLQQAQKAAENELSKAKLQEVKDWEQKQKSLYADYFAELKSVKAVVKSLPQIKQIISLQAQVVLEYKRFVRDPSRQGDFDDLLNLSREILQSLSVITSSESLSMTDSDRALQLCSLRDAMSECLDSTRLLNKQYIKLTASKTRVQADMQFLKKLNARQ